MKCSKCGHEIKVNDEVRFCYFCGAPQEQETPLSETGSALRKIYNDFGHEKIFENPRYITSALGDFIPDADIISTSIVRGINVNHFDFVKIALLKYL